MVICRDCGSIRRRGPVLVVGDVLAPGHGAAALVVLLHGDVGHEAIRSGAVPVLLAGFEEDAVAGPDDLDRAAVALAAADALGDEDRLAVRVRVPRGAGAGREVHERGGEGGAAGGRGDGVDVDVAGEPVGGALLGVDAAARDLHGATLPRAPAWSGQEHLLVVAGVSPLRVDARGGSMPSSAGRP